MNTKTRGDSDNLHSFAVVAGDEVLDVADGGADGDGGLARPESSIDLELEGPGFLVLEVVEIELDVLEVVGELAPGTLDLDALGATPDRGPHRPL